MRIQQVRRLGLSILFIFQVLAYAETPDLDMDMSIYGFGADSTQVYALKGGMRFGVEAQGKITKTLSYHGKMNIFFEEGTHTALNNSSYATATTYGIEEAEVIWQPLDFFKFNIGVHLIDIDHAPLFINAPSLGLGQTIDLVDYDNFELTVFARQNVVSVNSTQSRTGKIGDRAAYYMLGGFRSKILTSPFNIYFDYNYFSYEKLSAPLAESSRFRGNTVTGTGDSSTFFNDYKGHDISGAIEFSFLIHKIKFFSEYLSNSESNDTGLLLGTKLSLTKSHAVRFDAFENEADTLPAISVSPSYGGTNRKGQRASYIYNEGTSTITIDYFKMKTIDSSIYQDDLQILSLEYSMDV